MATAAPAKDRFVNRSGAVVGVSIRRPDGSGFKGIALYPNDTVDLDRDEQAVTANAPRDPRSNPLANGMLECVSEGLEAKERRPLRPVSNLATRDPANPATWPEAPQETVSETGAAVEGTHPSPEGSFFPGEEVGTPLPAPIGDGTILPEAAIVAEQAALAALADQEPDDAVELEGAQIVTGRETVLATPAAAPGQLAQRQGPGTSAPKPRPVTSSD